MRNIILAIESVNVFVWVAVLLFSMLFLGSPTAKFSHLSFIYVPLICGVVILLISLFVFKAPVFLIVGFIISILTSAPVVFYVSKKISANIPGVTTSTIKDRKPFILGEEYTSLVDYANKNEGKEIQINGKLFVSNQESKLFVSRTSPVPEVFVIQLINPDPTWNEKEIVVTGTLFKKENKWIIEKALITSNQ